MKKVLLLLIIALLAFTALKTDTESTTYMDFDDEDLPIIVKV